MNQFAPILPELILMIGAIVLMMVAAFGGRRSGGFTAWASVAVLIAATFALVGPPTDAGGLFGGLITADLFGSFGKAIIFVASAVAIIAAHGWFERDTEHGAEYSVLILFSALGGAVMVSATSLVTLYVGLELQSLSAYVLASYRRTDERSAEAGLKYFVLGALASGILLYGISLLYGFTGTMNFNGIAAAFARDGSSLGLLFGLVFVLAGIAFKISAVPFHMWTPDVYEGAPTPVTAFFASAPKVAAVLLGDPHLPRCARAGDRRLASDRHLRRSGLDLPRRGRGVRTDQHQAAAGLFVDQQCRLRAGRPCRRNAAGRLVGAVLHGRLRRDDTGRLPLRALDARQGRQSRRGHRLLFPACRRPVRATRPRSPFSCSALPASRLCSVSGRSCWCSRRR